MKGERRGRKVEVEEEARGPSHSFMEIKDVISVPARTSLILSLSSLRFYSLSSPLRRTLLVLSAARHFLHSTLAASMRQIVN